MIESIKKANNLLDLIYALEILCYYFGLRPSEFWDMRYKEVIKFCKANLAKMQDDFKRNIILQEAVTDKTIQANSMSKKPKIVPLRKMFKDLFQENKKQKTI